MITANVDGKEMIYIGWVEKEKGESKEVREVIRGMSNIELIQNIDSCEYSCIAGPLKESAVWKEIKARV